MADKMDVFSTIDRYSGMITRSMAERIGGNKEVFLTAKQLNGTDTEGTIKICDKVYRIFQDFNDSRKIVLGESGESIVIQLTEFASQEIDTIPVEVGDIIEISNIKASNNLFFSSGTTHSKIVQKKKDVQKLSDAKKEVNISAKIFDIEDKASSSLVCKAGDGKNEFDLILIGRMVNIAKHLHPQDRVKVEFGRFYENGKKIVIVDENSRIFKMTEVRFESQLPPEQHC